MITWAAIAPHGSPVFEQPDGPTRKGMEELGRQLAQAEVEALIVVTPHGLHADGHFGVVRSATLSEHASQFATGEPLYSGPGDPELAAACVRQLESDGLPVVGLTFGTTVAGASEMPIDWGAGIPLTFLRAPAVVVTPCRSLSNDEHVRAGRSLARATGDRRVAFVASADHGHGHVADGPYGFSEHSKPYDEEIQRVVRENALDELVDRETSFAYDAMADSLWQLLMLHGAIGDRFEPELLSYEVPTYFGMLTASYTRKD